MDRGIPTTKRLEEMFQEMISLLQPKTTLDSKIVVNTEQVKTPPSPIIKQNGGIPTTKRLEEMFRQLLASNQRMLDLLQHLQPEVSSSISQTVIEVPHNTDENDKNHSVVHETVVKTFIPTNDTSNHINVIATQESSVNTVNQVEASSVASIDNTKDDIIMIENSRIIRSPASEFITSCVNRSDNNSYKEETLSSSHEDLHLKEQFIQLIDAITMRHIMGMVQTKQMLGKLADYRQC